MITSTSRFLSISLTWSVLVGLEDIYCILDDTDRTGIGIFLNNKPPVVGGVDEMNLHALQAHYASDAGFQDANGDAITPFFTSQGFRHGTTVESLATFGQWNPLDPTGWDKFIHRQRLLGLGTQGLLEVELEQAITTVRHKNRFEPIRHNPLVNYDFPLDDWRVVLLSDTSFSIELTMDTYDEVSIDDLDTYPAVVALRKWLESIRQTGDPVETNVEANETWNNREYHVLQTTGATDELEFTYARRSFTRALNMHVGTFTLEFDLTAASAALSIEDLQKLIVATTVTLMPTEALITPPIGTKKSKVIADEIDIGDGQRLQFFSGFINYRGRKGFKGRFFDLPLGSSTGLNVSYDELDVFLGRRIIPEHPFFDTVHFEPTEIADGEIYFLGARDVISTPGSYRTYSFQNLHANRHCDLMWNATDRLLRLYRGEFAKFILTLERSGDSGRLIAEQVPERHMEHSADFSGNFDNLPSWATDPAQLGRPIRFGVNDNSFTHPDAFDLHLGDRPEAVGQGEIGAYTGSWEWRGAFTVNMPGLMFIDYEYELKIDSAGASLAGENGPRLYRFRNGTLSNIGEVLKDPLQGEDARRSYAFNSTINVQAGDLFFFLHVYVGATSFHLISVENFSRSITLLPHVQRDWQAV